MLARSPQSLLMSDKESIQSKGGKARKASLTAEQRVEIAKQAAEKRWANRALEATHKGNFQSDFGIDVDCYVLNDPSKTAVLSQRGMGGAIGLSTKSGGSLSTFLASKAMSSTAGAELLHRLSEPIKFQWINAGGAQPTSVIHGYDVTMLIDLCRAIIEAETMGALSKRYDHVVRQAHVILNASAKSGIKGLAYALAGYNPTAAEVIGAFKLYVQEEAKKYEKEFPPEIYEAWYRLYEIPPIQGRGRPWQFKTLTVDHIYAPLAKSNGKILELTRALKAGDGDRKKKLFQFLSEVGTRALRMHLGRVLEMAEDAMDKADYERKISKRFGGQQEFDLIDVTPPTSPENSA